MGVSSSSYPIKRCHNPSQPIMMLLSNFKSALLSAALCTPFIVKCQVVGFAPQSKCTSPTTTITDGGSCCESIISYVHDEGHTLCAAAFCLLCFLTLTTTDHCGTRDATSVRPCYSHIQPDGFVVTTAAAASTARQQGREAVWDSEHKSDADGRFWRVWQNIIGFHESLLPEKKNRPVLLRWLTGRKRNILIFKSSVHDLHKKKGSAFI